MPRDTAGNYTLPAGNPVASGEIISASWANSTMNDLGQSLSASLDRYGRGGMLAPFQFTDGTESAPGATWSNEPTTGLYRAAYGDLRFTLTGTDVQRWTSANAYLWRNSQWEEILTQAGGGGDTTINNLVVTGSFTSPGIDDNATSTAITIDGSRNNAVTINSPQAGTTKVVGPLYASTSGYNFNLECRDDSAFNTSNNGGGIGFGYQVSSTDYEVGPIIQGYKDNNTSGDYAGGLHFSTRASNQSPRVRMTITSDGDVGIGTNDPAKKLHVLGSFDTAGFYRDIDVDVVGPAGNWAEFGAKKAGVEIGAASFGCQLQADGLRGEAVIQTLTNGTLTPKVTVDDLGNLLVGKTTTALTTAGVVLQPNGELIVTRDSGATAYFNREGSDGDVIVIRNDNVTVGSISVSGSTTSYNPTSDARLKENIRDYDDALADVMKLKPRKYSWKVDGAEDNGFIAQELLETPEFANRVNSLKDGDDSLYGVDYMKFVAVLTGAIQEQQAMIETLQAEVAALKGA